ncbi:hypothetical protein JCM1840_003024 [Sporobolomyces johnsonii]
MAITHTETCSIPYGLVYNNHQGGQHHRYMAVPINCSTLPGRFSLGVDDSMTAYTLVWWDVKHPLELTGGCISLASKGAIVAAVDLWAGNFPSSSAGELKIPFKNLLSLSLDLTISLSLETRTKQLETGTKQPIETLAARSAPFVAHRSPNNVCFEFPRTSRQLWSNEDNLRKLSAYCDSLFSSDFAEGSTSSQAVPHSSSLPDYTYDDSDAETDELYESKVKSKKGEKQAQHEEQEQDQDKEIDGAPFKTVTVIDTAYTTYFAVLVWMVTGYIRFAPLRSRFRSDDEDDKQARAAELDKMLSQSDSQLPPPASPKSVYRLAHLLELPDLLQLALDDFGSQLSPANVAYELYSDVSCTYEAIRDVALEFTVANWKEVAEAEGTGAMERRAYAEELPKAAAAVSMLLARKLAVK